MTLCDTFKRLALDTWDEILKSRSVNFQLKEETLTDRNMLELKIRHSGQIKTKVFKKWEEGVNGSDWEWWFKGLTNNWIGFRIQAKIINIHSNEFEHLHYRNQKSGIYQSDKLIINALSGTIPRVPLYCLFLQTSDNALLNNWNCRTIAQMKDFYGCSLTSAFTVRKLRSNGKRHLTDLENHIEPWHCLVCCHGYGNRDFISNIQAYSMNAFSLDRESANGLGVDIPENFTTENPPRYVLSLLENEVNDNIQAPDEELDGLTIIMEKEEK